MESKDMILTDAIRTAIDSEKENIKLRRENIFLKCAAFVLVVVIAHGR